MDETERRSVKRSRFDQTEPERKRHSRFDRRSRSPPRRDHHELPGRDRSPLQKHLPDEPKRSPVADPAAAAAAAAARINAQLQARKNPPPSDALSIKSPTAAKPAGAKDGEMYISDGDFIKDIEINDLRNRYTLTKGAVQKMIKDDTGADVTTRGSYYPDKSMSSAANPPLYLHVTSTSKEGLDLAVKKIEDMMKQDLPQLVDERRFRRREVEPVEKDEYGRRKWPEEKIPINLEPVPGFNLRAQVVGHGGAYVKHIQHETGCRVQIKGRGSGFIETATQRESDEDMFLHVAGPDPNMVEKAKELCEDLLTNVKEEYESFKSRPPRPYGGHGGHHSGGHHGHEGGRGGHRERGSHSHGYNDRQQNSGPSSYQQHGYGGGGAGSGAGAGGDGGNSYTSSPAVGAAAAATASPTAPNAGQAATASDYAAQYAQYYGSDPYAAYGGYAAYVQMYQQYYGAAATQQQQQAQQASPAPGMSASPPPPPNEAAPPPPPPPSNAAPPPPPPPSAAAPPPPPGPPGAGSYNAVPPPPGL